jgi:hypothetical protein
MSAESLAAKALRMAPFMVYRSLAGQTKQIGCKCLHESTSQEWHTLTLHPDGTVTCDCTGHKSHGACYHPLCLICDTDADGRESYGNFTEAFADLTRSEQAKQAAQVPTKQPRPRVSEKERQALWG